MRIISRLFKVEIISFCLLFVIISVSSFPSARAEVFSSTRSIEWKIFFERKMTIKKQIKTIKMRNISNGLINP